MTYKVLWSVVSAVGRPTEDSLWILVIPWILVLLLGVYVVYDLTLDSSECVA